MKRLKRYTKILKNVYTLKKIKSCFWGNNFFSNFRGSKVQNFHFSYIFWILTYFKFQNSHIFMAIFALNVIQKLTGTNCFILSRILFYLDENTWYCNRKRTSTKKIIGRILQNHFFGYHLNMAMWYLSELVLTRRFQWYPTFFCEITCSQEICP